MSSLSSWRFSRLLLALFVMANICVPHVLAQEEDQNFAHVSGWIGNVADALCKYHKKHGKLSGGETYKHKEMLDFIADQVPFVKSKKPHHIGAYTSIGTISIKFDSTITDQSKSYLQSSIKFWRPNPDSLRNKILIHEDGKDTFLIWMYKTSFTQMDGKKTGKLIVFRKCKK